MGRVHGALIYGLILLTAAGCSAYDAARMARIAATGNWGSAQRLATEKAVGYALHPGALERDVKRFVRVLKAFRRAVSGEWGREEMKEPGPKEYVKYTQNYRSRASVDFDAGVILVETVAQDAPLDNLKTAIVTVLLTPHDPRAVDLFSSQPVKLGETPFLYTEVKDQDGRDIRWPNEAERFADHLIQTRLRTRVLDIDGHSKTVRSVSIDMVRDHLHVRAQKFRPFVERFARDLSVRPSLVYAVMKTESDFNPYAVSTAPAFGLMQIVPASAGRDVFNFLYQTDGIPSAEFLLEPEHSIHFGVAYLHLLHERYLRGVQDPLSREYCVIAGYNTGAGNVLRTFHADRRKALEQINRLTPLEVYNRLRTCLPYVETREYLANVMDAQKDFVNF